MVRVFHPRAVHVRIAAGCNLGCTFCERELLPMAGQGRRKRGTLTFDDGRTDLPIEKDMDLATWELVKAKFMPHTPNMELGGLGEPTLGKLFETAAKDIVAAGKNLFFFTNGHYLHLPKVLEAVGDSPRVSVSMDAGTAEAYKRIRKGNLDAMVKSVSTFRKAKPMAQIDSQFTAVASNIEELPRWVELCASLGIGRRENGETLLMIGADHHVTSRVDESIRFMKDITLAMIEEAREIAEREGLWFIAKPPNFSENNPNAITDGTDPRKLRRWSDLLFGEANPCDGTGGGTGGSGGSCLAHGSFVVLDSGAVLDVRALDVGMVVRAKNGPETVISAEDDVVECMEIVHEHGTVVCSLPHPIILASGAIMGARNLRPGDCLSTVKGPSRVMRTQAVGLRPVRKIELSGPTKIYLSGGVWHHNEVSTKIATDVTVIGGAGEDLPGAPLQSAAKLFGLPCAQDATGQEREIIVAPREVYVDYDGKVWSCLARHVIGDIHAGTWESIIEENAPYQEFLANWHYGLSNDNPQCRTCPRRK